MTANSADTATTVDEDLTTVDYDSLVDERTGILTRIDRLNNPPEWPTALTIAVGHVADVGRDRLWAADRVSTGTSFDNPEAARFAAIGEAIERYCGNYIPNNLRQASWQELSDENIAAVDPSTLCLYGEGQYREHGFPFIPFTSDLQVQWVTGRQMADGRQVLAPASIVYVNYFLGHRASEPPTNFVLYAGIAAGRGRRDAERSAMEEIIERDATEIWWRNGSPAFPLDFDEPAVLSAIWAYDNESLKYRLLHVPSVTGVPVIAALLTDCELDLVALGVAARPDPIQAACKAIAEAVALRSYAKGLLYENGDIWRGAREGIIDGSAFKPYRADRAYLDDYRKDFRDVVDLACQSQVWLDPRTRPWARHLVKTPPVGKLRDLPSVHGDAWAEYLRRIRDLGSEPVSVDLTTSDVASSGLSVVRVVAPGMYSNAPSGFALLGGDRLYTDPVRLGWRSEPLSEGELDLRPIPHT